MDFEIKINETFPLMSLLPQRKQNTEKQNSNAHSAPFCIKHEFKFDYIPVKTASLSTCYSAV